MRLRYSRSGAERHGRAAAIDHRIDTDTGEFEMIMATEGEASDGHILSVKGGQMPPEMPLQLDHSPRALANLGTVSNIRRGTKGGIAVWRGVGQIRLTGEGEALEARRDLVDAIDKQAVNSVSLTWEADAATERRELPRSHPAHVSRDEKDPRKRFGLFFESWRGIEQSIVGVPADRQAIIGRADAAENDVTREMWQSIASRLDATPRSRELEIIDQLEVTVRDLETALEDAEARNAASDEPPTDPPSIELLLEGLSRRIGANARREQEQFADQLADLLDRVS